MTRDEKKKYTLPFTLGYIGKLVKVTKLLLEDNKIDRIFFLGEDGRPSVMDATKYLDNMLRCDYLYQYQEALSSLAVINAAASTIGKEFGFIIDIQTFSGKKYISRYLASQLKLNIIHYKEFIGDEAADPVYHELYAIINCYMNYDIKKMNEINNDKTGIHYNIPIAHEDILSGEFFWHIHIYIITKLAEYKDTDVYYIHIPKHCIINAINALNCIKGLWYTLVDSDDEYIATAVAEDEEQQHGGD